MKNKKLLIELAIVIVILFFGAFVRFYHLTSLPPGLYPDEAMNTTDGLRTAEAGGWEWFYENNNGREGLYISILGYLLHWFGIKLWVVRFLPALVGTLTLPAVYCIGRRLYGKYGAIISLILISFSYWHINFSRIGFRALLMVLFLAWTSAFLVEGFYRILKNKEKKNSEKYLIYFAIGGLFLGVSLHTYIAVRIFPAAIFVLFVVPFIYFWDLKGKITKALAVTGLFAIITALPMLADFASNPEHFSSRTGNVSIMSDPNKYTTLIKTTGLTLASFFVWGDQNWRHNYPPHPLVSTFWGIMLFVSVGMGIYYFVLSILKIIKKKRENKEIKWRNFGWIFLISWWGFLLLPSILTREGIPHALRSIGALVPTFLLIGMVSQELAKKKSIKFVLIFLAIGAGMFDVYTYFDVWGKTPSAYDAFENRLSGMGKYLQEDIPSEPNTYFYFIANQDAVKTDAGLPVSVEPIRFFTWNQKSRLHFILPDNLDTKNISLPAKIVIQNDDQNIIDKIKSAFPSTKLVKIKVGADPDGSFSFQDADENIVFGPGQEEGFFSPPIKTNSYFTVLDIK